MRAPCRGTRSRPPALALLALLLALPPALAGCRQGTPGAADLPAATSDAAAPGAAAATLEPAAYEALIAAFYTGVTAAQVGDNERALARFRESTELAPDEPAAWANLALLESRANDPEAARSAIDRARALAPEQAGILLLAAQIADRRADAEGARTLLREAVAADPELLRARFALAEIASRQAGSGDAAALDEARTQLATILEAAPGNLAARLELARLEAKAGRAAETAALLEGLVAESEGWDAETRGKLDEARAAAGAGDARAMATAVVVLGNLLVPTEAYAQSLAPLQSEVANIGEPIERLITLPSPPARPAEPDRELTFGAPEPLPAGPAAVLWTQALDLDSDDPPTALSLGADGQLRGDGLGGEIPFPGTASSAPPQGLLAADLDNDQRPELVLAGTGGLKVYRRGEADAEGALVFEDATAGLGLDPDALAGPFLGAWVVDLDLEGDLDLVLGRAEGPPTVLRNNGDGSFTPVPLFDEIAGLRDLDWADLDEDGDPDIAILDAEGRVQVLANERAGRYAATALAGGPFAAIALADADHDGRLDLITLGADGVIKRWSDWGADAQGIEIARWEEVPGDGSTRLIWADLDNNGALDLVAGSAEAGRVWLAGAGGALEALAGDPLPMAPRSVADMDADGHLDLVGDGAIMVSSGGAAGYGWQRIRPRAIAQGDQRNNSFGLGGDVMLRSGLLAQIQPIAGPSLHFGLGDNPGAQIARVRWPNGIAQAEFDLPRDQSVQAEQRLKGSCPWLFAFDGHAMAFVTDILWRSPLGLRINAIDTAGVVQTRDWVRLRADQLAPVDGAYELRVTAELWETHFFDHVALMTVDHPAGTEVFVDERFAIPPPPLAIQATGPVRPPAAARDPEGRDVSAQVRARDGRYLDGFALGAYQGIAEDHWVELELPAGPAPELLVAQGWIYPTDSSINVAISQGGLAAPQDLSLEVPDGRGGWRRVREKLGFPAGKHKTMLIDLAGIWPPDAPEPRRLRLRSNLEIYWDALGLAERRPGTAILTRTLAPERAELRQRGISYTSHSHGAGGARSAPEIPDYARIAASGPVWQDLIGFYTRFGDVGPLLAAVDDRYAILNAGDEIALRFPVPDPPPEGWTRDFVFVSDGWEKDGDLNTSYSQTVLPLPAHDRPEYTLPGDFGAVGRLSEDPIYRRFPQDWVDYHTRYVHPDGFRRAGWPQATD